MGLILAGILAGVMFIGLAILYSSISKNPNENLGGGLIGIAIVCVIGGIFIGILVPVSGYEEAQIVSNTELVSLRNDSVSEGTGALFYVSISATNSYTYYVEIDSPHASSSQKAYKSKTISDSNVTIVEDDSYTEAKLVKYVKNGKKTFWTFAVGAKEYEYVFYVPTGTIARYVSLG